MRDLHRAAIVSREEQAKADLGHTAIEPRVAYALAGVFLAILLAAFALQAFGSGEDEGLPFWSRMAAAATEAGARLGGTSAAAATLPHRVVSANRAVLAELRAVDDELDHESVVGRFLRPWAQHALSAWLGAGNEQVYCGRGGWLFYRPDVEYLTAPGFLEPAWLERRANEAEEWTAEPQPDPRPAIAAFARALDRRGIALVVMPTPVKPSLHPRMLAELASRTLPQNPSYREAIAAFEAAGALVFDPSPVLAEARDRTDTAQYLATDTHWRPEAVELVAARLAEFIRQHVDLSGPPNPGYVMERTDVEAYGDLRAMLDLPEGDPLYPRERVIIRRVRASDGTPWRASRSAEIMILGDSFANIYSLASMGWGDSAGLAEQLSLELGRPVDRIVENDNGAFATRERLRRELASGVERLRGKRVVVYQFSARELSFGDWRAVDWPAFVRLRPD